MFETHIFSEDGIKVHGDFAANKTNIDKVLQVIDFKKAKRAIESPSQFHFSPFTVSLSPSEDELQDAHRELVKSVQSIFADSALDFKPTDFVKLQKKWGDLTPIYVLAGRYAHHKPLLKALSQIFKAEIEGRFAHFKFEGEEDPEAEEVIAEQLKALKGKKDKLAWAKNRSIVELLETTNDPSEELLHVKLLDLQNFIETTLIPNWKIENEDLVDLSFLSGLKNPKDFVEGHATNLLPLVFSLRHFVKSADLNTYRRPEFKAAIKLLDYISNKQREVINSAQTSADLKSLKDKALQLQATQKPSQDLRILASTSVSGAKALLTIGNCVKGATSCQNYRTGSEVETLLGYVMDAHVKAVLSFSLGENDFKSLQDFKKLTSALKDKSLLEKTYDEEKMQWKFKLPNDEVIESKPLASASRREMIKLGTNNDLPELSSPAILREPPYQQTSQAGLAELDFQAKKICGDILSDLDQVNFKPSEIRIGKSRGPEGHYSDLGGGKQTQAYDVKPR